MCSKITYRTGTGTFITGRGMDWNDPTAETALWALPAGMRRDGTAGPDPIGWTSRFGSVVASFYGGATCDGMNTAGLVVNVLYLAESEYGEPGTDGRPTISIGAWSQYYLDNFATVAEAVDATRGDPFAIVAPVLPNGRAATAHLSLSDASGDCAVIEYLEGRPVVHHGPQHRVMTNSPVYDQQLALNTYWDLIGGNSMLPGTISAADRFVRLSYHLKSCPEYEDPRLAVASVFSQMRAIGVPLGMEDRDHPNISSTLWRTVADHDARRYYFESTVEPSVVWVDLDQLDLGTGADVMALDVVRDGLAGEVSAAFRPRKPFGFIS
ncbi:linear amide C-N hydrolase [Streptomyces sp. TRM49041]|uniref:linear amide C-N hydrolase n=1 Tax=Streptomyces sp. TRM49041 TaxID=2603216 RepID=UPI0011EDDD88|nr:linear amide C-N hydrolase [Streptomyces sp. TRM49041]